jgi:hypothetical protein
VEQPNPAAEQWRPVLGFEGLYSVSDQGRVRSLDRTIEAGNRWGGVSRQQRPGRVLAPRVKTLRKLTGNVYTYASVNFSRDGVITTHAVHRLVLEAFVGPCPPGQETCHGPGGSTDNRLVNLRWGTYSENAYDRVRDGTHHQASQECCPYRHPLVAPNLDPNQLALGYRRCFACALTQMWGRNLPGDELWLAEAHRRFAEIQHFGQPLNYRLAVNRRPSGARWTPGAPGPWASLRTSPSK